MVLQVLGGCYKDVTVFHEADKSRADLRFRHQHIFIYQLLAHGESDRPRLDTPCCPCEERDVR
jgi:hypothetical protein